MRRLLVGAGVFAGCLSAFAAGAWCGAIGTIRIAQTRARNLAATHQAIELYEDGE